MKNMKMKHIVNAGLALCMLGSISANATDSIQCSGTVGTLGLHSPNIVYLKLSSMNVLVGICNLGTTMGTVNPIPAEQCKAIYSTLLAAYSMQKTVNVVFDNVVNGTSCTNFVSWENATARWVTFAN